jgi:hypothetical protein
MDVDIRVRSGEEMFVSRPEDSIPKFFSDQGSFCVPLSSKDVRKTSQWSSVLHAQVHVRTSED